MTFFLNKNKLNLQKLVFKIRQLAKYFVLKSAMQKTISNKSGFRLDEFPTFTIWP